MNFSMSEKQSLLARPRDRVHERTRLSGRGDLRRADGSLRRQPLAGGAGARGAEGQGQEGRPVEPVPAARFAARGQPLQGRRPDQPRIRAAAPSRWAASSSAPRSSTAPRPTPATWRCWRATATTSRRRSWLQPLLAGEIRSAFLMTEPAVASSDATNIETSIKRDGDHYVINGRKWWSSGVGDPRCKIAIVMGKTDPDAPRHAQQSQILVPLDAPGIEVAAHAAGVRLRRRAARPCRGAARRTCACRRPTCCSAKAAASRSRRAASGRGASTTACAPSARPKCALEKMVKRLQSRVAFGKRISEQTHLGRAHRQRAHRHRDDAPAVR